MSIDSIYAMLARPVQAVSERKRIVEQVKKASAISADSHEAPQSQLPPSITHKVLIQRQETPRQEKRAKPQTVNEKKNLGSRIRRMKADKRFSTRGETASLHIDIEV
ncbi:hypothetical protein [Shewanella livingstonensis]|uniref:Uncharacterized protein n=1 Tax=Shewanella livingstonensis TaxID=150120 RepID=A0A3G8LQT7_9GAMM|nr:hypothetical protein [Shewanella livingstonensis]AZG71777.1 hypothetical protein EGC82_02745 [Shewanella livingstonensis]